MLPLPLPGLLLPSASFGAPSNATVTTSSTNGHSILLTTQTTTSNSTYSISLNTPWSLRPLTRGGNLTTLLVRLYPLLGKDWPTWSGGKPLPVPTVAPPTGAPANRGARAARGAAGWGLGHAPTNRSTVTGNDTPTGAIRLRHCVITWAGRWKTPTLMGMWGDFVFCQVCWLLEFFDGSFVSILISDRWYFFDGLERVGEMRGSWMKLI